LADHEALIVHNVFTKHFNLPLTVALHRLLDDGSIRHCISWCHDISWLSPNSRRKLHTGYPWQLLRDFRPDTTYVAVSRRQQNALAELFGCPLEKIKVVYNGVAPDKLLGLSAEGRELADRLGLLESDLVLLMPVRITRAKNIEYALRFMAEIKRRTSCPRMILTGPPDPHDPQSLAYLETLRQLRQELDVENEFRFIYDSGPVQNEPYTIGDRVVGDLYRLSDVLFMPSHREGFGMPVLEAGMAGVPVVCTDIPVANEIGGGDIFLINTNESPKETAGRILETLQGSSTFRLRRRVRLEYTWDAIFRRDIAPLLDFLDQIP
jgi:glycosyltransferase involved in cell wall biosynthesis